MAQRFGVSLRTIYRDMHTLTEAGVPICGDSGIGYSLVDGYKLPSLMFTKEEAMAFLTAEKIIEQITDTQNSKYFRQGLKVIVTGRIQTGSYTNKEGQKVYTTDVVVEDQEFAESKAVSDANAGSFRAAAPSPAPAPATPVSDAGDGFMNIPDGIDEELPFN